MDGNELARIRGDFKLTAKELAEILCVSVQAVYYWEAGKREVPGVVGRWLEVILRAHAGQAPLHGRKEGAIRAREASGPAPVIREHHMVVQKKARAAEAAAEAERAKNRTEWLLVRVFERRRVAGVSPPDMPDVLREERIRPVEAEAGPDYWEYEVRAWLARELGGDARYGRSCEVRSMGDYGAGHLFEVWPAI